MLDCARDEELVLFYAGGNSNAFAVLYKRHYKWCYNYFFTCTEKDKAEASELCSRLFEKLMHDLKKEQHEFAPGMFEHWLHHRAHNDAIDWVRARTLSLEKNVPCEEAGEIEDKRRPRPLAIWKALGRELRKLKQKERLIFILRYFKKKEFWQIAIRLRYDREHASQFSKAYFRICQKLRKTALKGFL